MASGDDRTRGLLKVGGAVLWAGMGAGMVLPVWGQAEIRTHVAPGPGERFRAGIRRTAMSRTRRRRWWGRRIRTGGAVVAGAGEDLLYNQE